MIANNITIEGLKGVGDVSMEFSDESATCMLIGPNGVGKTKSLEALFQALFFTNEIVAESQNIVLQDKVFLFRSMKVDDWELRTPATGVYVKKWLKTNNVTPHRFPVVYLGSQQRGKIKTGNAPIVHLGNLADRRKKYFNTVFQEMSSDFDSMSMITSVESWFANLANTANPYQRKEDNRGHEIKTVLRILNLIDSRIDSEFIEISGSGKVSIKVEKINREVSHLSSGFSSILRIVQSIVSGYGNFSNEVNIEKVRGVVLIDEIESHLHLSWQTKLMPLLTKIFSNTKFIVSAHSPLVCLNLKKGEVYELSRNSNGIVKTREIKSPRNSLLVDIVNDAFGVDINKSKLDYIDFDSNNSAKKEILDLFRNGSDS
jgi:predicted ATP-binding protein involved in virulence